MNFKRLTLRNNLRITEREQKDQDLIPSSRSKMLCSLITKN
jgi:hypothetical protein